MRIASELRKRTEELGIPTTGVINSSKNLSFVNRPLGQRSVNPSKMAVTPSTTTMLMTSPWWQESVVLLQDNKGNFAHERKEQMVQYAKVIALFFGSYRNRPTKHFVKYLNKLYSYTTEKRARFEILYIPLDEEEAESDFFVKALMGDWLMVPWANQQLRRKLKNMYNVVEQPSLMVVKNDSKGSLVTLDGKGDLLDMGYFCWKEWMDIAKDIPAPAFDN